MAADEVVAHPTTVTGSIGVVMPGLNFSGLMERYGVSDQTLASGRFKDAGSSVRPMLPEERAQLQAVLDDLHARFSEVVAAGRPALTSERVAEISDGRVFSARQALALGLIDSLGYLEDAVARAEARAGIPRSRVVLYLRGMRPDANVYSQAATQAEPPEPLGALLPGFYYLWPAALGF
jgi:protease-4